jgi:hypothetical protein
MRCFLCDDGTVPSLLVTRQTVVLLDEEIQFRRDQRWNIEPGRSNWYETHCALIGQRTSFRVVSPEECVPALSIVTVAQSHFVLSGVPNSILDDVLDEKPWRSHCLRCLRSEMLVFRNPSRC